MIDLAMNVDFCMSVTVNSEVILENLSKEGKFSRKIWGLLSLEIWMQQFHDRAREFKNQLN